MGNLLKEIVNAINSHYEYASRNSRGIIDEEIISFISPYFNRENPLLSMGELGRQQQADSRRRNAISYKFTPKIQKVNDQN